MLLLWRVLLLLLLVILLPACPGKRRPPPWAVAKIKAMEEEERLEEEAARRPKPPPPTFEEEMTKLRSGYEALKSRKVSFEAGPTRAAWTRLMSDINAWQDHSSRLAGRLAEELEDAQVAAGDDDDDEDDPRQEELDELNEEVGILRAEIVEPKD